MVRNGMSTIERVLSRRECENDVYNYRLRSLDRPRGREGMERVGGKREGAEEGTLVE